MTSLPNNLTVLDKVANILGRLDDPEVAAFARPEIVLADDEAMPT